MMNDEKDLKNPLEVLVSGIKSSCCSGKDTVFFIIVLLLSSSLLDFSYYKDEKVFLLGIGINPYLAAMGLWTCAIIVLRIASTVRISGINALNLFICTMVIGLVWTGRKPIALRLIMGVMYTLVAHLTCRICIKHVKAPPTDINNKNDLN